MTPPYNELNWWIEPDGSTHTATCPSRVPQRPVLAAGKVYLESRSGVISRIGTQPASVGMISRQLLDALHTRFPGTRWWVKDPSPTQQPQTRTPAVS
ncbi:MAG: hypothetical protein ACF8MF_12020 [Phycisphaerales bacterium JB052]